MLKSLISVLFIFLSIDRVAGQSSDSIVFLEGMVIHAETKELVTAKITYQSLPYGNITGISHNNKFSFPMFKGEKYSLEVEAVGFAPAKYLIDASDANVEGKVIKDIVLTTGAPKKALTAGQVMRLNNLIFETGKSKIDETSYAELDIVVTMMKEHANMVIQLEGHTDFIGDAADNLKLSQLRVDEVRDYLVSRGISKSRIKTKAFGGSQPITRDNTPEGHRLNRRVELRILSN